MLTTITSRDLAGIPIGGLSVMGTYGGFAVLRESEDGVLVARYDSAARQVYRRVEGGGRVVGPLTTEGMRYVADRSADLLTLAEAQELIA